MVFICLPPLQINNQSQSLFEFRSKTTLAYYDHVAMNMVVRHKTEQTTLPTNNSQAQVAEGIIYYYLWQEGVKIFLRTLPIAIPLHEISLDISFSRVNNINARCVRGTALNHLFSYQSHHFRRAYYA